MRRIIRTLIGIPLFPLLMFVGTWIWLWTDNEDWLNMVGKYTWYFASGDWDKLPE